jgi:transcription antitermination factor NusA-like protein
MVQQITSKIMLGGIKNYAEQFGNKDEEVQIRISHGDQDTLTYQICVNWQPKEVVTFKNILNKKIDILNYEALATPFLINSLNLYQKEHDIEKEDVSVFIFTRNKKVSLAAFNKSQNVKLTSLEAHFEKMGL